MNIIEVKNLTKLYGKHRGISNVSFSVEKGEVFGFIGPNGAGKSTTIRTLLNLIYPTNGTATIFGKDIVKDTEEIRREVGYLPSEVNYYDDMKVIDLLLYSGRYHGKDCRERIDFLAKKLDLDINRRIEDLSYGNRKKVGIIQALQHGPKLLILDEPTGGLDPLMQNTFFHLLKEEQQQGTTIFFSSHILSEVQRLCNRVAIIKDGLIIKVESIDNLTKNQFKNITLISNSDSIHPTILRDAIYKDRVGEGYKYLYYGDTKKLVNQLNNLDFTDILIEEPSLEEIFLHYYENKEELQYDINE